MPETSRENSTEDDATNTSNTSNNNEDISQLAAQIASFVRSADDIDPPAKPTVQPQQRSRKSQSPPTPSTERRTITAAEVHFVPDAQIHSHPDRTEDTENANNRSRLLPTPPRSPMPPRRAMPASVRDSPENNAAYPERSSRTPTPSRDYCSTAIVATNDRSLDARMPVATGAADKRNSPAEKQLNTLQRNADPRIRVRTATDDDVELASTSPPKEVSTTTEVVRVYDQPRGQQPTIVHSLQIIESTEDLSTSDNCLQIVEPTDTKPITSVKLETVAKPITPPVVVDPERYKIRFVALKPATTTSTITTLTKPEPNPNKPQNKWSAPWSSSASSTRRSASATRGIDDDDVVTLRTFQSSQSADGETTAASDTPTVVLRRRRSVKDIIESINKSQSLLRINQTDAGATMTVDKRVSGLDQLNRTEERAAIVRNVYELEASEQQIGQSIREMEVQSLQNGGDRNNNVNCNANGHKTADVDGDVLLLQQLPVMVERYTEFSNEFKKCSNINNNNNSPVLVRRREKSISSDRTDWNPLPKPRRSRNLSHEAIEASATTATTTASNLHP